MMFSFGCGGSSSSSSSNLSPLAPPFTVDRFCNLNPMSNLNGLQWHYWPETELGADSMRTSSVPVAEKSSASHSVNNTTPYWPSQTMEAKSLGDAFSYVSEATPFYPPYASPVVSDSTPLLAMNEPSPGFLSAVPGNASSQVDYTQSLAGLQYSAPFWNALKDEEEGKMVKVSGGLLIVNPTAGSSNVFKNSLSQGGHVFDSGNKTQDNSGTFCGNFTERETQDGFLKMGHMTDKSYLVQELGQSPSMLLTSSELQSIDQSMESSKDFRSYQKPYTPYEKSTLPRDSFRGNNVQLPNTVVIRAPTDGNVSSTKKTASHKTEDAGKFAAIQVDGLGSHDPLKGDLYQPPISIGKGVYSGFKHFNVHKDDGHSICNASWPLKENFSCQSHVNGVFDQPFESNTGSQVAFTKVLDDISLASNSIQAVHYTENHSDGLDPHYPNIDSPCWKGAPASRTSPFRVEAAHPPHGINHFPVDLSTPAISRVFSGNNVDNANGSAVNGVQIPSMSPVIANYTAKEHLSTDAGKQELEPQTLRSNKGVEISCALSNSMKHNFGDSADAALNINETSEGCTVALHAAEKVLHSPSSQEGSEDTRTRGRLLNPKMDVQTLVMAIHNISELLRFHCSTDGFILGEQDHQTLKSVINNLNACRQMKIGSMNTTEPKIAMQDLVNKTKESFHIDTGLDLPQLKNEAANCLHNQPSQSMHESKNCSGEKRENFELFPSSDDVNMSEEDNVAQAIMKVLNENFHFDGEMKSQAALFKNLWLEAEAKLCSISYRARFDHMKIAMEMQNSTRLNENKAAAENTSSLKSVPNSKADGSSVQKTSVQSSSIPRTTCDNNDIDDSTLVRYNILKRRDVNSNSAFLEGERDSEVVHASFADKNIDKPPVSHKEMQDSMGETGASGNSATGDDISSLQSSSDVNRYSLLPANTEGCSVQVQSSTHCNDDAEGSFMDRLNILKSRDSTHFNDDDDAEGSVMARLNILKSRFNVHCNDGAEDSFMSRLNILKSREGNSYSDLADSVCSHPKPMHVNQPGEKILQNRHVGVGKESRKEFELSVANDQIQPTIRNNRVSKGSSPLYETSSSDWEHVLKDDFAWQS